MVFNFHLFGSSLLPLCGCMLQFSFLVLMQFLFVFIIVIIIFIYTASQKSGHTLSFNDFSLFLLLSTS